MMLLMVMTMMIKGAGEASPPLRRRHCIVAAASSPLLPPLRPFVCLFCWWNIPGFVRSFCTGVLVRPGGGTHSKLVPSIFVVMSLCCREHGGGGVVVSGLIYVRLCYV